MIKKITEEQAREIIPSNIWDYYKDKKHIDPIWFCPVGGDGYMNPPLIAFCEEEIEKFSENGEPYELRKEKPETERDGVRFQKYDPSQKKFVDQFEAAQKAHWQSEALRKLEQKTNQFFSQFSENKLINEALIELMADRKPGKQFSDFISARADYLSGRDIIRAEINVASVARLKEIAENGL